MRCFVRLGLIACLSSGPALADATCETTRRPIAEPWQIEPSRAQDESFLRQAAAAAHFERELGRLAQDHAEKPEVRQLGREMIEESYRTEAGLRARAASLEEPPLTDEQEATRRRLAGLSGSEFDRAYLDELAVDHEKMISLFQEEARGGLDPELRSFALGTLPSLRKHERMAERPAHRM
jgi:putative membrane protein